MKIKTIAYTFDLHLEIKGIVSGLLRLVLLFNQQSIYIYAYKNVSVLVCR